jgi:hypothetical protein
MSVRKAESMIKVLSTKKITESVAEYYEMVIGGCLSRFVPGIILPQHPDADPGGADAATKCGDAHLIDARRQD